MLYDRAFRRRAEMTKYLNWSVVNTSLFNLGFERRARHRAICQLCLSEHHTTESALEQSGSCSMQPPWFGRAVLLSEGFTTCYRCRERWREALTAIGLDPAQYVGHSFRIGAATTGAAAGIEDSTIQALGRWSSSAFLSYIRLTLQEWAALSSRMNTISIQKQY